MMEPNQTNASGPQADTPAPTADPGASASPDAPRVEAKADEAPAPASAAPTPAAADPSPPAATEPPPPAAPTQSDAERERLTKTLADAQAALLTLLWSNPRPKPDAYAAAAIAYGQAVREAGEVGVGEWPALKAIVLERWNALHAGDAGPYDAAAGQARQYAEALASLFDALPPFEQSLGEQLARMRDDAEFFVNAPQPLRDVLLNYKKGVEIIQRLTRRVLEKKKTLAACPDIAPMPPIPETAPEGSAFDEFLSQLAARHHDWRAARSNGQRDAQKAADTGKKETLAIVKGLLGALDGIEGGLHSEAEILERIKSHRPEYDALIDAWFGAYARLDQGLTTFYAATALKPHRATPGERFQVETMEPGGTVSDPARQNEDIASMLRCGYSFLGEHIRPILVEVVVNSATETKG